MAEPHRGSLLQAEMPENEARVRTKRWLSLVDLYTTTGVGGTEMYAHRLNCALLERGFDARAALYTGEELPHSVEGVRCHALPRPPDERTRRERFAIRPLGVSDFESLLDRLQPTVVHFHSFGPCASLEHVQAAKSAGATVVATYHSPGFSCQAHALLYRGRTLCDGELRVGRCTRCCLVKAGLPLPLSTALSVVDLAAVAKLAPGLLRHPLERRRGVFEYIERWRAWMNECDVITYAADWIRDLLLRNGIAEHKLVNLPLPPPTPRHVAPRPDFWHWAKPGAFRLLFAGRVVDIKGAHVLVDAVRNHLAGENVALCMMGAGETPSYTKQIELAVEADDRIRLFPHQPEAASLGAQLACDAVVVPSLWPETGPYSVLEAQWMGTAIVGSDRAGIAQLLGGYPRGFLFEPGNAAALADALKRAANQPKAEFSFDREGYSDRFHRALGHLIERGLSEQ